jgi:hypothetical protein
MKIKIKEISYDSGKSKPPRWKLIAAVLGFILLIFKNEILEIFKTL